MKHAGFRFAGDTAAISSFLFPLALLHAVRGIGCVGNESEDPVPANGGRVSAVVSR